ncbi:MAG: MSMEG_6728 family protein [Ignavibacteriaceae bacterium]|nr:MSMEG_6728 family protein [Ignavibacteriaceae bacterium]
MQTFLPYPDFVKSAKCLDYRRLEKQRVEAKQLLTILLGANTGKGWINHPACKMWKGYSHALALYGYAMCVEWKNRGFKDTLLDYFLKHIDIDLSDPPFPPWFGNRKFHRSHKSNLLRKDIKFYSKYKWNVPDNLDYVWPV